MLCKNCGKEIPEGNKFCPNCGSPAAEPNPAQQTTPQPDAGQAPQQAAGTGAPNYGQAPQQAAGTGTPNYGQAPQQAPIYQQPVQQKGISSSTTGIIAYLSWIGFLIALLGGTRDDYSNFHLNQALVLNLFSLLGFIPVLGCVWDIFVLVAWIICFVGACSKQCRPAPLLGGIRLIK